MNIGDKITLTSAGKKLAKTVAEKTGVIGEQVLTVTIEIEKRRKKYKSAQLQLAAEADREIGEVTARLDNLMAQKEQINEQLFEELRETHKELKNTEFSIDFNEGTAVIVDLKRHNEEINIEDLGIPPELSEMLARLLAGITKKKEEE